LLESRSDYISPSLQLNFAGGFCVIKLTSVFISHRLGFHAAAPAKKALVTKFLLLQMSAARVLYYAKNTSHLPFHNFYILPIKKKVGFSDPLLSYWSLPNLIF